MKTIKMMMIVAALFVAGMAKAVNNPENLPIAKANIPASVKLNADSLKAGNSNSKYILWQYWSKYNSNTLKRCIEMDNTLRNSKNKKIEMVMVSFNPILLANTDDTTINAVNNCLLDRDGKIIAYNINPEDLAVYIKTLE